MGLLMNLFGKRQKISNNTIKKNINLSQIQDDYAKTVFLWCHKKVHTVRSKNDYAQYFLYECNIKDASSYHKKLINEGYFNETPIEKRLSILKVVDLKTILNELGQATTGKKDELIKRIVQNMSLEILEKKYPEKTYELSDKGAEFLDIHNEYVLLHQHRNWNIDLKEYIINHQDGESFYDTMWRIFNQRILKDTHLFGRTEYYYMYQLLKEEGKRKEALEKILRVLYIDLSGVESLDYFKLYKQGIHTKKDLKDHYDIAIMLAPGIINSIPEFIDVYDEAIIDKIYEQKLPIQVCNKELFKKIVSSIIEGTYNEEKIQKELKKVYYKIIDEL